MRSFTGQLGTALSGLGNVVPGLAPGAAIKAKRCYFPRSSWVHAFILTCDDKLAVWFKRGVHHVHGAAVGGVPGVCCLYPQSNQSLYNLAVAWWSAGHFVHQFLYRVLGYVVMAPPKAPCGTDCPPGVVVDCCGNALPATLHATFTGPLSGLGSLGMTWNGTSSWGANVNAFVGPLTITVRCVNPGWAINLSGSVFAASNSDTATCSPLIVSGSGFALGGTFGWTVTT